ncbi:type VI secretion system tip protein TssI/VgrG [Polyangium sp. 15x6]|uniref:type VI secretion system tip protein TssI/VgrG n=1 Tax=Polyangium sp. 15x6 TaxID=3042687 RepID=UPI00249A1331|nr:type VI secretion system tip protein TssI/VgrG [Polyangium sp. 15x6]MDI3291580.1 type VI secretion system tip protein TssI/VgrG [Polyangium sp. 15x6]
MHTTTTPSDGRISLSAAAFGPDPRPVVQLSGVEEVSHPFRFVVHIVVEDPRALVDRLLGMPATLTLRASNGAERRIHGVVERASVGTYLAGNIEGHEAVLELVLVPQLALLGHRTLSRVFQDMAMPAAASSVLAEHRVAFRWNAARTYPPREYCVQYRESDLSFIARIAAEAGIHYHFADAVEDTVLVFCDAVSLLKPVPGAPQLNARPLGDDVGTTASDRPLREDQVAGFHVMRRVAPTSVLMRDYDFERPLLELRGKSAPLAAPILHEQAPIPAQPTPGLSLYEHHGEYEESNVDGVNATILLEQLRHDAEVGTGDTGCRLLAPGFLIELHDHPIAALNEAYVVTRVEYTYQRTRYQARFHAVPQRKPYRPAPPERRVVQTLESATVTGPAGQEIHTDEHGRVRVRFHWDLRSGSEERTSCFVRVLQPWAGTGWGSQFIPRIGMEVLVSFLGGDPDRPVVLGSMVNATHPHPFPLPSATRSGIRTSSTPNARGYNELSFEDAAGAEELFLRAERDLRENVQNDRITDVGRDRHTRVARDDHASIEGLKVTRVGGDEVHAVEGSLSLSVSGGANLAVAGNTVASAQGDHTIVSTGSVAVDAGGGVRVAGEDFITLRVDHAGNAGEITADVAGDARTMATREVLIRGDERVRLRSGDNEILLTPEGITLRAKQIRIEALEKLDLAGKGPSLSLGDEAELVAKKVRIYGEKSALELDRDARIWGDNLKLQPPAKPPPERDPETNEPKTKPLSLRFLDDQHEPYDGRTYQLVAGGQRFRGELDDDGVLKVDVPESAATADVTIWIDTFPEGRRRRYSFQIGELPPAKTPRGAKQRLKSLGYFPGEVNDVADEALRRALQWFQTDYDLATKTGALDGNTAAELEKLFGQ